MAANTKSKQRYKLFSIFRRKQMTKLDPEKESINEADTGIIRNQPAIPECEFECPCCQDVMLEPTTLPCGHNFCRLCLARTYYTTNSSNLCPVCRHSWESVPRINTLLRSTIESLFPEQYAERKRELQADQQAQRMLQKFNTITRVKSPEAVRANAIALLAGVICTVIVLIVVYALYWVVRVTLASSESGASPTQSVTLPSNDLSTSLISNWTQDDVLRWLDTLGEWTDGAVRSHFQQLRMDGKSLAEVTESDLPQLNIHLPFQQKVFMNAIESLKYSEQQQIGGLNLWAYMSSHHVRLLIYYFGLSEFPRLTLLYLYYCDFSNVVRPFLKATFIISTTDYSIGIHDSEQNWMMGQVSYVIQTVFIPYLLIFKFCWLWSAVNKYTMYFLMYTSLVRMYQEVAWLININLHAFNGSMLTDLAAQMKPKLYKYVVILALYPVLPSIFCDVAFYFLVFFNPLLHFIRTCHFAMTWAGFI